MRQIDNKIGSATKNTSSTLKLEIGKFGLGIGLGLVLALAGCGKKSDNSDSGSAASLYSVVLNDLRSSLSNVSVSGGTSTQKISRKVDRVSAFNQNLTEEQLNLIISKAQTAISNSSLDGSNDLGSLLPVIAGGAEDALDEIGVTIAADKILIIKGIGAALVKSAKTRETYLVVRTDAIHQDQSAMQSALMDLSNSLVGHLDDTGLDSTEVGLATQETVGALVGNLDDAGIEEASIKDAIESVTAGAVSGLDDINLTNYDSTDLPVMVSEITEGATAALDDLSSAAGSTITADDLQLLVGGIAEGAVASLDNIEMTGYSDANLADMVSSINGGVVSSLDDITMTGYDSTDLSVMVKMASAGAVSGLDDIAMTGYDASDLPTMIGEVTAGATSSLDEIVMPGYDSTDLPAMVADISAGATSSLDDIVMTDYDVTDLTTMVEAATGGATSSLDEIQMVGYDATDLGTMVGEITAGATSALDEISMTGYDANYIDDMSQSLTAGVVGHLDDIAMTNYDSSDISAMVKEAAEGATSGLQDIDTTKMTGFDGQDMQLVIAGISEGAIGALSDISSGSFASYDEAAATSSIMSDLSEGIALGAAEISDDYGMTFSTASLANWVYDGATSTGDTYTIPSAGSLQSIVDAGYNADPQAAWAYFDDTYAGAGILSGTFHIGAAGNEANIDGYRLVWANCTTGSSILTVGTIGSVAKASGSEVTIVLSAESIPNGADCFGVHTYSGSTNSDNPYPLMFMDKDADLVVSIGTSITDIDGVSYVIESLTFQSYVMESQMMQSKVYYSYDYISPNYSSFSLYFGVDNKWYIYSSSGPLFEATATSQSSSAPPTSGWIKTNVSSGTVAGPGTSGGLM